MKRWWYWLSAVVTSLGLGIGSAVLILNGLGSRSTANGPWRYNQLTGSTVSGPYLRASVAMTGLLALNQSEAVYLQADTDTSGQPLLSSAVYRVEIPELPARWWSITAYAEDLFLIPNEFKRYGFNSFELAAEPADSRSIVLSRSSRPGNWVPTGDGKTFSLILRLYNPIPEFRDHLAAVPLPRIIRQ